MDYFFGMVEGLYSDRCKDLESPSYLNLALSILILLGILVSYLPQHHKIISRGTSEGISPWFILLGTTSGTCAFANILVLPKSRADVACCKTLSFFECTAGLLGIAQVGVQWFCFSCILLLFLIFFPRVPSLPTTIGEKQYTWKTAITVAIICLFHGLAVVLVSAGLIFSRPHHLGNWANALGIMATVLAGIQYIPQIWMTWRLRDVGSLSIPMMCIQTPGSFVWSASLAARLGLEGWSTWGVFLVTGCLQGSLLIMGCYFRWEAAKERERLVGGGDSNHNCIVGLLTGSHRHEPDDEGSPNVEDERTPLVGGSKKLKRQQKKDSKRGSKKNLTTPDAPA